MGLSDWFQPRRVREDDLAEEIGSHLAMSARDLADSGRDAEGARRAALKAFGNVTLAREATRLSWGGRWREHVTEIGREVAYAVRLLARAPAFSLIVIGVLALGIGANASMFAIFKSLALKPVPGVEGSGGFGLVTARSSAGRFIPLSYYDYQWVRDHDRAFSALFGVSMQPFSLGLGNRGERIWGEMVTGNYFQALGVQASLGRTLVPADEGAAGQQPVVVIGDGLWRRAFGADPNIVGRKVLINAYPLTVVGVTPPVFQGTVVGLRMDAFIPVTMQPRLARGSLLDQRAAGWLMVFGRPRRGVSLATAAAQTELLARQLATDNPSRDLEFNTRATVVPIRQSPYGAQTYMLPALVLVLVMGGLVLLIVCANIANLVLVRGLARRGEIAARLALGASRGRILRLLLVESLVVAAPGAVAGLLIVKVLQPLMNDNSFASAAPVPVGLDASMDVSVVAFALLLSCGCALVFGFVPALQTSRIDLASTMKDALSPRGAPKGRFRAALVVSQVALSLLLLVGAGTARRSLTAAAAADVGFDGTGVVTATVDLQTNGYDEKRGRVFYRQAVEALREEPGIDAVSLASALPLTLVDGARFPVGIEGYTARPDEDLVFLLNVVSADYFKTLRIGLLEGREFEARDDEDAQQVAIVNETLARRFWTTPSLALGRRVRLSSGAWRTVVGVARDLKYARVNEDPRPYVYVPIGQRYRSDMTFHVRGSMPTPDLLKRVRDRVQAIDPNTPIVNLRTLTEQTRVALSVFGFAARALAVFGVMAMALAALGIYGLVSYTVKQSTHEIGIRMALGAQGTDVVRRFLGRGLRLALVGAAIGLVMSLAGTRAMSAVLYGVGAMDPVSLGTASAIVLGMAVGASLFPAWRAARVNPIAALRQR